MGEKKIFNVPIALIKANPNQPRKSFNEKELDDLESSIREYGVLQPIILSKCGKEYFLIAGERRLKAASRAGFEKIPAIIKASDKKDSALIALVENVQRENLSYIEEAYAYKRLMTEYGLSQQEIAKKMGKKQSTISNKIRILNLPDEVQAELIKNKLTERHARALLKIEDDTVKRKVLVRIVNHNLNVKQSEKLIDELLNRQKCDNRKSRDTLKINYMIYINSFKRLFEQINKMEKNAKYSQTDLPDSIEIKILIPKSAGPRAKVINN